MGLRDYILSYKIPDEFIFIGEKNLTVHKYSNKKWNEVFNDKSFSIKKIDEFDSNTIKSNLTGSDYGVILNSSEFIFNLLQFEKLPSKKSVRSELIEWKIRKLFPDMFDSFYHKYFKLSANSVLSILINRELKERIENKFDFFNEKNIYFGSSTIEIIKNIKRRKLNPDFFIEFNINQNTMVFLDEKNPYYIRKLRFTNWREVEEEIQKTLEFVEKNYKKRIKKYLLFFSPGTDHESEHIFDLKGMEKKTLSSNEYFLPKKNG